jgi:hypothetical protein
MVRAAETTSRYTSPQIRGRLQDGRVRVDPPKTGGRPAADR